MAWEREDECVGCAECIHCGRKGHYYMICYCDECGEVIDRFGYKVDGRELCSCCAAEAFLKANVHPELLAVTKDMIDAAGYDINDIDDVYTYFDTPTAEQYDVFDVTESEEDYDPWDD